MTVYTATQTILCLADSHGDWIEVTAPVGPGSPHPFTIDGSRLRVDLEELEQFGKAILTLVADERAKAADAEKASDSPEQPAAEAEKASESQEQSATETTTRRTRQRTPRETP